MQVIYEHKKLYQIVTHGDHYYSHFALTTNAI